MTDLIPDNGILFKQYPIEHDETRLVYGAALLCSAQRVDEASIITAHTDKINERLRAELYNMVYGEVIKELNFIMNQIQLTPSHPVDSSELEDKIKELISRMKGER